MEMTGLPETTQYDVFPMRTCLFYRRHKGSITNKFMKKSHGYEIQSEKFGILILQETA